MGFISELVDFVQLAKKAGVDESTVNDARAAHELFKKAKSISEQAAKYRLEYPVAVTSSLPGSSKTTPVNVALKIAKQIELNCARYVILTCGLKPVINLKNDSIDAHLQSLTTSFESYSGFKCTITRATPEQIADAKMNMSNMSTEEYKGFKRKSSFCRSTEETVADILNDSGDPEPDNTTSSGSSNTNSDPIDSMTFNYKWFMGDKSVNSPFSDGRGHFDSVGSKAFKTYLDQNGISYDRADLDDPNNQEKIKQAYRNFVDENMNGRLHYDSPFSANDIQKLDRRGPTIISINFILADQGGGMRTIPVPLAIFASLQFIPHSEIVHIIEGVENRNTKFQNFIKLTTGQINFFTDWLFQLEEAKRDAAREEELGRIPFYRHLQEAKTKNRLKTIGDAIPFLKGFINKKSQKEMPICTVIVTLEELERGLKVTFDYALRNKRLINNIIDTYMLLCLGVVDDINESVYFFFAGEDNPQIISLDKVGNQGDDDTARTLAEVLKNQSQYLQRH